MVGRHVCSDKAEFERPLFDALSYVYLTDVWFTPRQKKERLLSEHVNGTLAAAIRSPLMKTLNTSVKT